jgi:hypothetical protein
VRDQFARVVLTPAAGVHSNSHLLVLLVDPAAQPLRPVETKREPVRRGARK